MNSFNHYAYGAIGEWMYRRVAGLDMDDDAPGFRKLRIEPLFGAGLLTHAKASHLSMYGRCEAGWFMEGGRMHVHVVVPPNAEARVVLRGAGLADLTVDGVPMAAGRYPEGILSVAETERGVELEAGSGEYRFSFDASRLFRKTYTENSRLVELLNDDRAAAAVRRRMPHLFETPALHFLRTSTLRELTENGIARVSRDMVESLLAELAGQKSDG